MAEGDSLTIGEVINLLKDDFPDATVSKVRFLESQGLINPGRSPSGYRQFMPADIKRLRFILEQQRDQFLPLKVIRSQLTLWERDEEPDTNRQPSTMKSLLQLDDGNDALNEREAARRAGITRDQMRQLVDHGLIIPEYDESKPFFTARDIAIARQCGILLSNGIEPRHLRFWRHAAQRGADLLLSLTMAMRTRRSEEARQKSAETIVECSEALNQLMALLMAVEIRSAVQSE